jgi:Tol biopolymer transport system component
MSKRDANPHTVKSYGRYTRWTLSGWLVLATALVLSIVLLPAALADNGEQIHLPIIASPPEPGTTGIIAFTINSGNEREIYTINPDGSEMTRLTFNEAVDNMPTWSANGELIAFTSDRRESGYFEIFTMLPDGSDVMRLTSAQWEDNSPSFAPDSEQIVFASNRNGAYQIFIMDSDGDNQLALTSDTFQSGDPEWSPDGQKIVYSTQETGGLDIYVMDTDGANKTRLTMDPAFDFAPAWSPDGSQIVFTSRRDGEERVYVMNADGSDQRRLVDFYSQRADWSPDGARILLTRVNESSRASMSAPSVFASDDARAYFANRNTVTQENSDLYTLKPDGSDLQPLTDTADDREDWGNWAP